MENTEEITKKRKDKILEWIKEPSNLAFILIFIGIIIIRFYYFFITKNQPLWWDESQYMSGAKDIAGIVDYNLGGPRLPFYSFAMSIFFFSGITNEPVMRFIALFLPSLIVILLLYFCIREMYPDKKIALISTAIIGVLWEHLFYSNRFHTENPSLIFLFLATLVLFRCYVKKKDLFFIKAKYSLLWIILFSIISVLFRPGTILAIPALALFIIILNKDKLYTKKGVITSIIFLILITISILYVPKLSIAKPFIESFYLPQNKIAWNFLTVFNGFYQSVIPNIPPILFYFFLAGIVIFFIDLFLGFERIKNLKPDSENLEFKSDIFSIILIVTILLLFIFIMRMTTLEYRWLFPLLIGMLAFTSKGVIKISEYILSLLGVKSKKIILAVIIIIVAIGVYNQYLHSDMIIKDKINSFEQVKEAGLLIKQNSNPEDIIISASQPQITYYSERTVKDFSVNGSLINETDFNKEINSLHPKFIVLDAFQPYSIPKWAYDWPQRHNDTLIPVKAYFIDAEQKQSAVVIYGIIYNNQSSF